MGVKLSDLSTEASPASNDIIMIADPVTGIAKKLAISALKTLLDGLGGGTDTTAPTIVSIAANTASTVTVTFSESVTVTTGGWSFKRNSSSWGILSVAGSGTVWTFTMAVSAATGETLTYSYSQTTGVTVDTSSNELANATDAAVTNNIPGTLPTLVDLTFPTNIGPLVNTSGVWSAGNTTVGGYNLNKGLSGVKLASGQDGWIQMQYVLSGGNGGSSILGFNTANSNDNATTYEAAAYLEGAILYKIDNGSVTAAGVTMTSGHYVRVNRTGSTIKMQQSSDGTSWSDILTFTFSSTADLFICASIDSQTNARMHYPKGYNVG